MSAHDWFRPRLQALLGEAEQAGYARDVAEAVITDLMNGALADAIPVREDADWNRDIGEPDGAVYGAQPADPQQGPRFSGDVPNPMRGIGQRRFNSQPK